MRKTEWHADSWNRCLDEELPELLADRLPVASYSCERSSRTVAITLGVIVARLGVPLLKLA